MEGNGNTAKSLRRWARSFIADRENLPFNLYGTWNISLLNDGNLAHDIFEHLQSIGEYVSASHIVQFLNTPEIKERYSLEKSISLRTAQRWMHLMDYRWTKMPHGQYKDGHKHDDVVAYWQEKYIPALQELQHNLRVWRDGLAKARGDPPVRWTVIWYHDESTFYAHDRRTVRWVHKNETAVPRSKGEGASLMVADFVSADYGWLASPDGQETARVLFRAGKGRDGYFTNEEILKQVRTALAILEKYYPEEDHVFIFDNATTHQKRADGALSARNMPKFPSQKFFAYRNKIDGQGQLVYRIDGQLVKEAIPMTGAKLHNGSPQDLYFPMDHQIYPGAFKGMVNILAERRYADVSRLRAQCEGFKCAVGAVTCCCRRLLFNEPDFVAVESSLQMLCRLHGVQVVFLPKFHCELNPIEQCWGYAKRKYREYPRSSKESDLVLNVIKALSSVPLKSIRRCV